MAKRLIDSYNTTLGRLSWRSVCGALTRDEKLVENLCPPDLPNYKTLADAVHQLAFCHQVSRYWIEPRVQLFMTMVKAEIPVISFEPFLKGDKEQRKAVAKQVYDAFHNIGFLYLKDNGITQERIDEIFALVSLPNPACTRPARLKLTRYAGQRLL